MAKNQTYDFATSQIGVVNSNNEEGFATHADVLGPAADVTANDVDFLHRWTLDGANAIYTTNHVGIGAAPAAGQHLQVQAWHVNVKFQNNDSGGNSIHILNWSDWWAMVVKKASFYVTNLLENTTPFFISRTAPNGALKLNQDSAYFGYDTLTLFGFKTINSPNDPGNPGDIARDSNFIYAYVDDETGNNTYEWRSVPFNAPAYQITQAEIDAWNSGANASNEWTRTGNKVHLVNNPGTSWAIIGPSTLTNYVGTSRTGGLIIGGNKPHLAMNYALNEDAVVEVSQGTNARWHWVYNDDKVKLVRSGVGQAFEIDRLTGIPKFEADRVRIGKRIDPAPLDPGENGDIAVGNTGMYVHYAGSWRNISQSIVDDYCVTLTRPTAWTAPNTNSTVIPGLQVITAESSNYNGEFDAATSRWTCPITGRWHVNFALYIGATDEGAAGAVRKFIASFNKVTTGTGTPVARAVRDGTYNDTFLAPVCSRYVYMNAGDQFQWVVYMNQPTATARTLFVPTNEPDQHYLQLKLDRPI